MIRYIASDLDGTLLLNGAQELDPEVFSLILRLKEKGSISSPPADASITA